MKLGSRRKEEREGEKKEEKLVRKNETDVAGWWESMVSLATYIINIYTDFLTCENFYPFLSVLYHSLCIG